jgi:transposase
MITPAKLPSRDAQGRTVWVTRARPKVDRIACPWLIRRFVDPKDRDAVQAAIASAWSNGQTEGQICKLKLVKRQMYGRGKIDPLQARVIGMN